MATITLQDESAVLQELEQRLFNEKRPRRLTALAIAYTDLKEEIDERLTDGKALEQQAQRVYHCGSTRRWQSMVRRVQPSQEGDWE
jgi:hypothetical protein